MDAAATRALKAIGKKGGDARASKYSKTELSEQIKRGLRRKKRRNGST